MKNPLSCLFPGGTPSSPEPALPLNLDRLESDIRRLQENHEADLENHRRMLVGKVMLAHAQTQPDLNAYLRALLDHFLEKDEDRALFGLPPREIPLVYVDPSLGGWVPVQATLNGRVRWKRPLSE